MSYRITVKDNDPMITLQLPGEIVADLAERAEENGRDFNIEIAMRLARTLERDLEMIELDNIAALDAFNALIASDKDGEDQ